MSSNRFSLSKIIKKEVGEKSVSNDKTDEIPALRKKKKVVSSSSKKEPSTKDNESSNLNKDKDISLSENNSSEQKEESSAINKSKEFKLIKAFRELGVGENHINTILEHQKVSGIALVDVIRELGFPESETVAEAMALANDKEYLNPMVVDGLSREDFPEFNKLIKLSSRKMTPLAYDDARNVLKIGISEDSQISMVKTNYHAFKGSKIEIVFASQETIENTFLKVFSKTKEEAEEKWRIMHEDGENNPRSHSEFLNSVIKHACFSGVSDIHFIPLKSTGMIKFRVDGDLEQFCAMKKQDFDRIMQLIRTNGKINDAVQDTKEASYTPPEDMKEVADRYRFRVQISRTVRGEAAVFRILDSRNNAASIDAIGFDEETRNDLIDLTEKSAGLILITGPTGSGKTTTLYSLLKRIDPMRIAIHTVENPVEYQFGAWNQHEIRNSSGDQQVSEGEKWAIFFKGLLRNDIDVALLGEVRDKSTADAALQLSNTGHLVWTTLHTNSASRAITRLVEMKVNMGAYADVGLAILAQRLLKRLCHHCKEPASREESDKTLDEIVETIQDSARKMEDSELERWKQVFNTDKEGLENLTKDQAFKNLTIYKEKGCPHCGYSGYKGRKAVYELLKINKKVRKLIVENATGDEIMETIPMTKRMWGVGVTYIISGETTLRELRRRVNKEE